MVPVLEAVPNFSEGRDLELVGELVRAIAAEGVDVLDWSADPDHNRSVVTFVGEPAAVEEAAVAAARLAVEAIDLRGHEGVHPRVGALDVLPFVPLRGLEMDDAVETARRVGGRLSDLGVPVYFYGEASDPPGRSLAELRRGGVEALLGGYPADRLPDLPLQGAARERPHPTAGATCVGARKLLLAWNVVVDGVSGDEVRELAADLREGGTGAPPAAGGGSRSSVGAARSAVVGGGFAGLRVLGLELPRRGKVQISMNLEDVERTSPFRVYRAIEAWLEERGGSVVETEVIGMIPDALVLPAAEDRLQILDPTGERLLSARLADHLAGRAAEAAAALVDAVREGGDDVPPTIREAATRLARSLSGTPSPGSGR